MKKVDKPKRKSATAGRMTLLGYYNSLPPRTFPKSDFIDSVAEQCGVEPASVRNWVMGRNKPSKPEHIEVLVQMTGVPAEQLWQE